MPTPPNPFLVFVCHEGRLKLTTAYTLYRKLKRLHIHTFLDLPELKHGGFAQVDIQAAAREVAVAILVLSPEFVTSRYVMDEVEIFLAQKTKLVPVFIGLDPDECMEIGEALTRRQTEARWAEAYKVWVKLSPEEQNARGVLIREVKEVTGVKQADSDVEDIKLDSAVESACQELRASHLWPSVSALKALPENPINQTLIALHVQVLQRLRKQLDKRGVAAVLEDALEITWPVYFDNHFTSELLELLYDASDRMRVLGNDRRQACSHIYQTCIDLLHDYRGEWGWDAFQLLAIIAFNVGYDGAKVRDKDCFQYGVQLLTTVCQAANAAIEDPDSIRDDHWAALHDIASKNLDEPYLKFFSMMRTWSQERFSAIGQRKVQDKAMLQFRIGWLA